MAGYQKKKAFTLIELLVVISIIALLLSILAPSLAKVKRSVETTVCTTKFKDIGNALGMYVVDYNGKLPPSYVMSPDEAKLYSEGKIDTIWMSRIASYYDKSSGSTLGLSSMVYDMEAFRCPTQMYYLKLLRENRANIAGYGSMVTSPKTGRQIGLWAGAGVFGYNCFFSGLFACDQQTGTSNHIDDYNFRRFEDINNSSNLPMVADLAAEPFYGYKGAPYPPESQASNLGGWLLWPQNPHPIAQNYGWKGGWWSYGPAAVHDGGKINYLFADGHAESRKMWPWDDVTDMIGDGQYDRYQYFHPKGKRFVNP